jgi:phenylacetic acid degradation protein
MPKVYAIDGVTPVVDPSAFIHPAATLIGDVVVGANCYVGPGASLRGDMGQIVMKPGSNMQDNCIAHTFAGGETVLEESANVGHGAILHGCHVGRCTLIGMNAVLMDGAVIGDFSFVAALAFVKAGFEVPPRTIAAGIPAKVLRDLNDEEIQWKHDGDQDYQGIIRRSHRSLEHVEALTDVSSVTGPRIDAPGIPPLYKTRNKVG